MSASSALLFVVCLLVSFLYSGIEAGLSSLNRARLRSRMHQGDPAAIRLGRLLAHPGRLLATVLLVTNFADVAALVLLTHALYLRWGGRGCVVAGAVMLPVLLGLQVVPKSLFRRFPYRALAALVGVLEVTSKLLRPLLVLGSKLVPEADREGHHRPGLFAVRDDLKVLAAEGERAGALTPAERGMIHNVIDFSSLTARDFLSGQAPATLQMNDNLRVVDLLAFAREQKADFVPVLDAEGKAVALVDGFALLLDRDPARSAAVYLRRRPLIVAPNEPALRVLRRLRASRLGAAVVLDEETRFLGVVRAADLVGRLVRQTPAAAQK